MVGSVAWGRMMTAGLPALRFAQTAADPEECGNLSGPQEPVICSGKYRLNKVSKR